jgi:hypothetical protein
MKAKEKFLVPILLTLLSIPAYGSSVIEGGLGVKLGGSFSGTEIIGNTTGEVPIYKFSPSKPLPKLDRYGVIVTPKTRKIVEIWAWSVDMGSTAACKEQLERFEIAFDKKYGGHKSNAITFGETVIYRHLENKISINCPISFGSEPLYVQYSSDEMEKLRLGESIDEDDFGDI